MIFFTCLLLTNPHVRRFSDSTLKEKKFELSQNQTILYYFGQAEDRCTPKFNKPKPFVLPKGESHIQDRFQKLSDNKHHRKKLRTTKHFQKSSLRVWATSFNRKQQVSLEDFAPKKVKNRFVKSVLFSKQSFTTKKKNVVFGTQH